jgi:hypothetical protein
MPKKKYSSYKRGGKVKKEKTDPKESRWWYPLTAKHEFSSRGHKVEKGDPITGGGGFIPDIFTGGKPTREFFADLDEWGKKYTLKKKKYKGGGKADTVSAMLTPGEVVLNAKQQEKLGKLVGLSSSELFGKIGVPGFEDGGKVNKKTKYSSYIIGGKVKKEKRMPRDLTPEELKRFNEMHDKAFTKELLTGKKTKLPHPKKLKKGEIRRDSYYDKQGRPVPDPYERDWEPKKVYMKSKLKKKP